MAPKIAPGSAPAVVTAAFQKDHPNAMIKQIQKETYKDGTVHYVYTFIDSSGLRMLIGLNDRAEQEGWTLALLRPAEPSLSVFQITGADDNLPFIEEPSP